MSLFKADLSYLMQDASNLLFLFFLNISDSQWENITGILKSVFKISSLSHYRMQTHNIAWHIAWKFYFLLLTNVQTGKTRETQNYPSNSFSHNFCHWLLILPQIVSASYFKRAFTASSTAAMISLSGLILEANGNLIPSPKNIGRYMG